MKQKLYALDAFFIEKLKLSENDPVMYKGLGHRNGLMVPLFIKNIKTL